MASRCYLGLGSNLGDRLGNLRRAADLLATLPGVRVLRSSRIYETEPVGGPPQAPYLNAVLEVECDLGPRELLAACGRIEAELGRVRAERWGARTIDVDILTYGAERIAEPALEVPHPRMHERAFVLAPLAELDADPPLPGGRRLRTLRLPPGAVMGARVFAPPLLAEAAILGAMDVAVIGAGRVGTALAVLLARAGYRITAVAGREATRGRAARHLPGVPVLAPVEAAANAELVLIGTPDAVIQPVCAELARAGAFGPGRAVAHVSGATSLSALASAEAAGALVLSIHPLQTCPDVEAAVARIPGAAIAVTARTPEGSALGERLARDIGGRPFPLEDAMKPVYHAAAVFASNYLVTLTALAAELAATAGVPDPIAALEPLQRATLENVLARGPQAALTGPAVRGDATTVETNLRGLAEHAPWAVPAYVTLAELALRLASEAGRLAPEGRAAVEEVLARWR